MSLRNPVRYPVKYYSWQDAQAPQLANANGVIKTILKACLVTGYGDKAGAGWTALFEDDYRIVLRRPLRTGNPPDIKIENGTITGTTVRHRIVAQDNPTGLDDVNELSAVNLLARDPYRGQEWHCIVADFGFILCYQMGRDLSSGDRNNVLYIGALQKLRGQDAERFVCTYQSAITTAGMITTQSYPFLSPSGIVRSMRENSDTTVKNIIALNVAEKYIDNDYLAQKIIINDFGIMPFTASISSQYADKLSSTASIAGRLFLRYINVTYNQIQTPVALYIPLDYWEL